MQQCFPAVVPQHAYQRVVYFDESSVGTAEEEAFLNVVEEFAITALGLAAVGDVLKHMDGLQPFAAGRVHLRRGDQKCTLQHRVNVFIREILGLMTERARAGRRIDAGR